VNNIELAGLRPSATLQNLAKALQIAGAVAGVGSAFSEGGALAAPTKRIAGGNQALLPATWTSPLAFESTPTKTLIKDPSNLFVNF